MNTLINLRGKADVSKLDARTMVSLYKTLEPEIYNKVQAVRHARWKANKRAELLAKVTPDIEKYGFFMMVVWSRDCDMCESTSVVRYESLEELEASQEEAVEWAEGPVTWDYIPVAEGRNFKPTLRDRVMEAYENTGQGYYV